MIIQVTLTPAEESRLSIEASKSGLGPEEFARKVLREHISSRHDGESESARTKLHPWRAETNTETMPSLPAHTLFAQRAEEDSQKTDEELAADDQLWQDGQISVNNERRQAGGGAWRRRPSCLR
jgi:hypothetical protein